MLKNCYQCQEPAIYSVYPADVAAPDTLSCPRHLAEAVDLAIVADEPFVKKYASSWAAAEIVRIDGSSQRN